VIGPTTNISRCLVSAAFLVLPGTVFESGQAVAAENKPLVQWTLPRQLREISGLALTEDQRLFAVTDEEAIVYELDYESGSLIKSFALGQPPVRGDFEGIAVLHDTIWLMTSGGDLYSSAEGADGERMTYEKHTPDFAGTCELEGIAADKLRNSLILVCKDAKKKKNRQILVWSMSGQQQHFRLPEAAMAKLIDSRRINPSGIDADPQSGNWIIIAARQKAVFELSRDGELLDVIMRLDPDRHRQPEGVAITNDGRFLIVDEANKGPARLAVYRIEQTNSEHQAVD
jgi:uncharacterized protein YjiK